MYPEKESTGERSAERMSIIIYSVYSLILLIGSIILRWGSWIPVFISIGMLLGWTAFIKRYRNYRSRAFFMATLTILNFLIYGMESRNLFGMISTFSALVFLLSLYMIPEIIYLAVGGSVVVFLYHVVVSRAIRLPRTKKDIVMMCLLIISMVTIEGIAYYLVKSHNRIREELEENIAYLKGLEKSKDDFMANVSHEIRTPINAVCGISEMILMEDISPEVEEDARDIQIAGRNLMHIVGDLLDFSEIQSEKIKCIEEPYNITSTVNDIINTAMAQMENLDVELFVDCAPYIPRSLVGDEPKIRRVITNLVNNSIKYTQKGCIKLSVDFRKMRDDGNLLVRVSDTGMGIKEENLEKLFQSFSQVDTKRNRNDGGVGLGLAISQALVEKMGGFLTIESTWEAGTDVQFVIPQRILDHAPIIEVEHANQKKVISYVDLSKYDIALSHDNYSTAVSKMAQQLGVYYLQCRSLEELKKHMQRERYTHVFIGRHEYQENADYFDEISREMPVIMVVDPREKYRPKDSFSCLYKPVYSLTIASALDDQEEVIHVSALNQNGRFIAPDASVMIVDDSLMNLKVVEGLLRPYRMKVYTAISGKDAINKLEKVKVDFVFMDHMMPEMDGVETLHNIRKKPETYFRNVPIIALTANAIGGAREMFMQEGFQDFVSKPIDIPVFERVLKKYIPQTKIIRDLGIINQQEEDKIIKSDPFRDKESKLAKVGIDLKKGLEYCGGKLEDYKDVVEVYCNSAENNRKKMEHFYKQKDWENYTIFVHALKSSSLSIGAVSLSKKAAAMEKAGKENNEKFIVNHHDIIIQNYKDIVKSFQEILLEE